MSFSIEKLPAKISAKIMPEPMSGCWLWIGGQTNQGYGTIGGRRLAHRFSFEFFKGQIPEKKVIDHLCRNPCCVNPNHLDVVSVKENTERGVLNKLRAIKAAARTHCRRGHLFVLSNIRQAKKGRYCKICQAQKAAEWRTKNKHQKG